MQVNVTRPLAVNGRAHGNGPQGRQDAQQESEDARQGSMEDEQDGQGEG